jgi:ATP-dependent Lhr-like helicase
MSPRSALAASRTARPAPADLPTAFADWFATRGWHPRAHQLDVLSSFRAGEHVLLIAPTGGGKTLAGFLPSLIDLAARPPPSEGAPLPGIHTLYVSPLKALATDIARNLTQPVDAMRLPIRIETRTGDTPTSARARQRDMPPDILLTTPESLALLLSQESAGAMFSDLRSVVIDEVHAMAGTKRGDLLALGLARLDRLAPGARRIGLSATVAHKPELAAYVSADGRGAGLRLIEVADPAPPDLSILLPAGHLPWSGHMGLASAPDILERIRAAGLTIVFVNTRAQAELIFQDIWRINEDTLP